MPIHFRCARCQSSFPVGSQLRDRPNQCPICKCTSLSAELSPPPPTKVQRTAVSAPARASTAKAAVPARPAPLDKPVPKSKPTNPEPAKVATDAVRRGIDWRIVGGSGAGACLVVGCAILAIVAHGPRPEPVRAAVDETPVAVAAVEEPVAAVISTPEPAPAVVIPVVPPPPAPEVKPEPKPVARATGEKTPLVFKRRSRRTDEEMRRELLLVPEMGVNDIPQASRTALAEAPKTRKIAPSEMPDFRGLPMRMGIDCQIGDDEAKNLEALSRKLRTAMFGGGPRRGRAAAVDNRPDVDSVREQLLRDKDWQQPEAIATLTQMLMPEGRQLRLLMVEMLAKINGSRASVALAQRAVFDLSQEVREAAVTALRDRPIEDYRSVLVQGFRYPWVPPADHAAEAIVALEDRGSLTELLRVLREPNPIGAFRASEGGEPVIREMVRVNHLANCTLCHAASPNAHELVRGRVPSPLEPLPPPVEYYSKGIGIFVRADVTYLQQDFSVPQPVTKPGPWPTHQRYDYMIRLRPLKTLNLGEQVARIGQTNDEKFGQREAVLFALRELTGKDVGRTPASWDRAVGEMKLPQP